MIKILMMTSGNFSQGEKFLAINKKIFMNKNKNNILFSNNFILKYHKLNIK